MPVERLSASESETAMMLPDPHWSSLLEGLVRKRYQVLLGAGFSFDVRDRLGRALPSGDGLRDEIVAEFGLPVASGERIDLSRAYSAASRKTSVNGQSLEEWLKFRFSGTTPPDWYEGLKTLPLQGIWTLNIDDSIERLDPVRFKPVTFADKHNTWPPQQVPVVHLHGYAAQPEKGLIFSISEYRQYVSQPRAYALQFQEALSDGPVIVVGAALHHETDLAQALRERAQNRDSRWPSIIVKPHPSEFERDEFEAWGLEVIDGTGEGFLSAVRAAMPETQRRLAPKLAAEAASSPATMRFNQQWNRLAPTQGARTKYRDFLTGAEPLPSDVREGRVIRRDMQESIKDLCVEGLRPVLLHGMPFCGKSTLALAVATELHDAGWQVYQYAGDERIDTPAVLSQVTLEPHTLLLVDDAALIADDLRQLIEAALARGVALHLLCVDRTGPASRLLRWTQFEEVVIPKALSKTELGDLVALLGKHDRFNKAWRGRSESATFRELNQRHLSDFAAVICETVIGEQFEERVRRDFRSLANELARGAYLLGCVLARVSKGAPVGLVAAAFGTTGRRVERTVEDLASLESVCTLADGRIRPRHRRHAELLIEKVISPDEAFDPLVGLAKAVAPSLDVHAIRYETTAYRISAEILDQDRLADLIGPHRLEEFYAGIEDEYAWNSRYWEQRALAASANRAFGPAIKFSNMALSAHRDAFSLNTAASIQFQSLWDSRPNVKEAQHGYWSIIPLMREARDSARPDSEYPYVTFFTGTTRFARTVRRSGAKVDHAVIKEWAEWEDAAERSMAFRDPLGQKKLIDFKKNWLKTNVVLPTD